MKKVFLVGLMGIMFVSTNVYGYNGISKENNHININTKLVLKQEQDYKNIEVKSKVESKETELAKIQITTPYIQGLIDKQKELEINNMIDLNIKNFKEGLLAQAEEWKAETEISGINYKKYYIGTDYKVKGNDNILSIILTYSQYTGGAHGMYKQVVHNINLKTGEIIQLKDLYNKKCYKDDILNEVKEQIEKESGKHYSTPEEIEEYFDEKNFYVDGDDIIVYYDLYTIAPYASGIREFRIQNALTR